MGKSSEMPVAIVTGAARGIGSAIAKTLAKAGYGVVIVDAVSGRELQEPVSAIQAAGGKAIGITADLADLRTHGRVLEDTLFAFKRLDCLVNNAGVSVLSRGDLLDVSPASYDHCMAINTRACFFLSQMVARYFVKTKPNAQHRSIINISSSNATAVSIDRSEYGVSKAAVSMITKTFAVRLAPLCIGVYEVRPGTIETEMTAPYLDKYRKLVDTGTIAMPRLGRPEDVARAVLTLAQGNIPYSVGQVLEIDGGMVVPKY